ncbi:MAG: sigma-54-dependent transcriptional regulator [Myxococcota bacterium]
MKTAPRILVVDDERAVRTMLRVSLKKAGMVVSSATNVEEALELLRVQTFDLILTDVNMPGSSGLELLKRVKVRWPDIAVVVMTGKGSITDAVAAVQGGAADYLVKPVARDALLLHLERALQRQQLQARVDELEQVVDDRFGFDGLVGQSPAMLKMTETIAAVADAAAPVLLQGETGTGKELLAHALHYRSPRRKLPFVRVNCAALAESILESELFGHEKGAFTGAIKQRIGKFEAADGGTLFLDEVGELSAATQAKLLRVLESGEFQRVGGNQTVRVDVRVVSATNRHLEHEVEQGTFRRDLFYRLNVVTLKVPALRERLEDLPLLVDHFLAGLSTDTPLRISEQNLRELRGYTWPGNIRELRHLIEQAVLLNRDGDHVVVTPPFLNAPPSTSAVPSRPRVAAPHAPAAAPHLPLRESLAEFERALILAALDASGGTQAKAAAALGISTSNLSYRMKRLGIARERVVFK